jgi:hypothetical protein
MREVSINRDMYLGKYIDSQNSERIPEGLLFAIGVLSTVGLPQLTLSVYGGTIPLMVLAGVTLCGSIAGGIIYRKPPSEMPRCVDMDINVQSPPRKDSAMKKAA